MDTEFINVVLNYDTPEDSDTYFHRVSLATKHLHSTCNISARYWRLACRRLILQKPVLSHCLVASKVARARSFRTKVWVITFVSDENDVMILNEVQQRFEVNIAELPEEINIWRYSKLLLRLCASCKVCWLSLNVHYIKIPSYNMEHQVTDTNLSITIVCWVLLMFMWMLLKCRCEAICL